MIQRGDDLFAGTNESPRFFAAYSKTPEINLVHGALPHHRCYTGEQFVVPDKKDQTVSRRDYR